jgi:hypothetical protein
MAFLEAFTLGDAMIPRRIAVLVFALAILLSLPCGAFAQAAQGSLHGQVADPSGAVVTQATITLTGANGQSATASPTKQGAYEFKNLAPGKYTLRAVAAGFSAYQLTDLDIPAGHAQQLDINFEIAVQQEKVEVEDQSNSVDTTSSNNANATVIKGKDLDALSDDPDELQSDLQALAGPSAGPNGGQIYIDGFTNGQLPPKASIREIRVNQNPFSAQYDRLGYGRVEVFTKPGMDQFHGQLQFQESNSFLNAKSPFGSQNPPDYHREEYSGNVSGPLNKKASFFLNAERRIINDNALVYAQTEPLPAARFTDAIAAPRRRTNVSPRLDYQLTTNNTLTARYQFVDSSSENNGVGQLNLADLASNSNSNSHMFQVSDTQVLSPRVINETRFQFVRDTNESRALNQTLPFIQVQGAFNTGGNSTPRSSDVNNQFEIQNYTSMALNKHFIRYGTRVRTSNQTNTTRSNFNGSFTYTTLDAYLKTMDGLNNGWSAAQIVAAGGGASLYRITSGEPSASVSYVDAGAYAEDDWRLRPNLTLSYGLRYETQNNLSGSGNLAPRVGIAWGLGKSGTTPKTVLRAGYGVFYDRVGQDLVMQAERLNGINQTRMVVNCSAALPCIPSASSNTGLLDVADLKGTQVSPTLYQLASNLRAPYTLQVALTLERQLAKTATASLTYLNSRGQHLLVTKRIPGDETLFQYSSEGIFKQNQLIANMNIRAGAKLSLFGFYSLSFANGDTSGAGSVASNSNYLLADYGRASYDVRNRLFFGGMFVVPFGLRLSPFIVANSGMPFNITLPNDLNGDSVYNDRPAFADSTTTNPVVTKWGTFDLNATGKQPIPINYGQAKPTFTVNLRVARTFGLGPKLEKGGTNQAGAGGPGGDHRGGGGGGRGPGGFGGFGGMGGMFGGGSTNRKYSLTVSASARNLLNHVNAAPPSGVLGTELFGQSTSLAGGPFGEGSANRRIELQMTFGF